MRDIASHPQVLIIAPNSANEYAGEQQEIRGNA
jgi:hypothetical protein